MERENTFYNNGTRISYNIIIDNMTSKIMHKMEDQS